MNAAAYVRVSSGMQVETGASLPSQLTEIRSYCRKHNLELIEDHIYTDAGESARTDDRPAFQAMIAAARQRPAPFQVIVCWENSRFARSREDAITYKALLKKNGVDLRFVKQDFEDTPMGAFMEGIVELVDEWYSKNLAVETRRGLIENARQGYSGGGTPPFGLRRVVTQNEYGKDKATREPDPATAPIVREIYEMRANKAMGYRNIAYELNARGILSPKGGDWNANTIYYILTKNQPAYLGNLVFNRADYKTPGLKDKPEEEWVVVENAWPAIITEELVGKVNSMISEKRRGGQKGRVEKIDNAPFVLSGKVVCGICGGSVNGVTGGRKGAYRYYRCNKSRDAGPTSCSLPQLQQKRVEEAVFNIFQEQVMTDGLLEGMIEVVREGRGTRNEGDKRRTSQLRKDIAVLENKKRNLLIAVEDGMIDMKDARTRIDELNELLRMANRDLAKLNNKLSPIPPAKEWDIPQFRKSLSAFMEMDRSSALSKFMDSFINKITVYPDRVDVDLLLIYPGKNSKFNVQHAPNSENKIYKKTASSQSGSRVRGCKSEVGAEDET